MSEPKIKYRIFGKKEEEEEEKQKILTIELIKIGDGIVVYAREEGENTLVPLLSLTSDGKILRRKIPVRLGFETDEGRIVVVDVDL